MAYNRTIRGRRGETDFCFHTPMIGPDGITLGLDDIDFGTCDARLWVTPKAGGTPIIAGKQMTAHPDQVTFPQHIAYFATHAEMMSPAGDYSWQIVFTDSTGRITTYPKDGSDGYGLFRLLPTLDTTP